MSRQAASLQDSLPGFCPLTEAVEALACASLGERGAIFTRREVVDFILDLSGYTADKPLYQYRLLEPSFGDGDFLLPSIERLLASCEANSVQISEASLGSTIQGVELHHESFAATAAKVQKLLRAHGLTQAAATRLCERWLTRDDFLLTPLEGGTTHVVGNPPYIRQEAIPQTLIDEYRRRYSTIYDRADIYVPFIERSLRLLAPNGAVAFICADRWVKNRYGGPLRELIATGFHLRAYVDMVDTQAFHSDVVAYPAIFVIGNERGKVTRLAHRPAIDKSHLAKLAHEMTAKVTNSPFVKEIGVAALGSEPWLLEEPDQLALVRRLESLFPTLEEAGCKVGIGVATGADKAFIGKFDELDVEADRKLPLVMTRDILTGKVAWRGYGVINPFADGGGLVALDDYPLLKRYLEANRSDIAKRHVAQKAPANWYRTIDRIYPEILKKPKLLIPDIKGEAHVVYDKGEFYPHHNLYYITSDTWDLQALQAVLLSGIARLFIATYSTKMRGGYLRFQAQYLRRIRVPQWGDVSAQLRKKLIDAGRRADLDACNSAVAELYGLEVEEQDFLADSREAA